MFRNLTRALQHSSHLCSMAESGEKNIVIIGGGIIGCTTAYFLTRHPSYDPSKHNITLLEASEVAGGASGKAGGLLALWAYPSNIVPLSYKLHAELAAEHDGASRWGYRRIHCGQLSAKGWPVPFKSSQNGEAKQAVSLEKRPPSAIKKLEAANIPSELNWFDPDAVLDYGEMGDPSTTAQVHPFQFTTSMAALAAEKGVKILTRSPVKSVNYTPDSSAIESVTYQSKDSSTPTTIPATDIVVAAGPWTRNLLPTAPIAALRAHSVVIRPSAPISAHAIFTEISLASSGTRSTTRPKRVSPEIYARPDNTAYACGEGDTLVPLPSLSSDVEVDQQRCDDILSHVGSISDELRDGQVLARQACYLPNCQGAVSGPLVGSAGVKGLWLAAGHTCWGIQNGPGTGRCMAEFVFEGKAKSARIEGLDPRRAL